MLQYKLHYLVFSLIKFQNSAQFAQFTVHLTINILLFLEASPKLAHHVVFGLSNAIEKKFAAAAICFLRETYPNESFLPEMVSVVLRLSVLPDIPEFIVKNTRHMYEKVHSAEGNHFIKMDGQIVFLSPSKTAM